MTDPVAISFSTRSAASAAWCSYARFYARRFS